MRVLTFFNHAGGAGKSSLTLNVGHTLASLGYRVLLIDADPQANLTKWLGLEKPGGEDARERTLFRAVIGAPGGDLALPPPLTAFGMDVVPSTLALAEAEPLLPGQLMGQIRLRSAVRDLGDRYDFALIDSPPNLGQLTTLAVLAADQLVVPVPAGNKGLEGLEGVLTMVNTFRRAAVPNLGIALLVPTQVDNTNISRDSVEALRAARIAPVSSDLVYRPSQWKGSQTQGVPLAVYAPRDAAAREVRAVARELLAALGEVPRVGAQK